MTPEQQSLISNYKTKDEYLELLAALQRSIDSTSNDPFTNNFFKDQLARYQGVAEYYFPEQGSFQAAQQALQAEQQASQNAQKAQQAAAQVEQKASALEGLRLASISYGYKVASRSFAEKNPDYAKVIFGPDLYGFSGPLNEESWKSTQDIYQNTVNRAQELGVPVDEINAIIEPSYADGANRYQRRVQQTQYDLADKPGNFYKALKPLMQVASVIPSPIQPLAAFASAGESAMKGGSILPVLAALTGVPGVSEAANAAGAGSALSAIKAANQANNLYKSVESGNILGAIGAGVNLTGTGNVEIGDTGYNVADAVKAANIAKAVDSGNYGSLIKALAPGMKLDSPSSADVEEGYFAPGGEGYFDSAVADSITPTNDELGYTPSNQEILDAIGYTPETLSVAESVAPTLDTLGDTPTNQGILDAIGYTPEAPAVEAPVANDVPEMVITAPRPSPSIEDSLAPTLDGLGYTPTNQEILDAIGYTPEPVEDNVPEMIITAPRPVPSIYDSLAPTLDELGYTPSNQEILDAIGYTPEAPSAGITQDQMTPEDWAALYAQPTTDPITGETIVGGNPADYPNQDFGVDVTVPDDFTGEAPELWRPNEDGTLTLTSDDGSTLTIDSDGNIVGVTESTDTPYVPEKPVTQPKQPVTQPKQPVIVPTGPTGLGSLNLGLLGGALAGGALAGGVLNAGSGSSNAGGGNQNNPNTNRDLRLNWNQQGVNSLVNGAAYGQKFFDPQFEEVTAATGGLMSLAAGGSTNQRFNLGSYSDGGRLLRGPGDGMSDNIPATIANKQPARLADGEFVIPADVVSHLGNGSTNAGSKVLYEMMEKIRRARTGNAKQGKKINPNKLIPR